MIISPELRSMINSVTCNCDRKELYLTFQVNPSGYSTKTYLAKEQNKCRESSWEVIIVAKVRDDGLESSDDDEDREK